MPSLSGKPAALLAYLAVAGSTPRERLVALLWGDGGDARSRNAFRQTLHRLRTIAGPALFADARDSLAIAPAADMEVDVEAFRSAVAARQWQAAVELYTGEFLQGLVTGEQAFDEWIDGERRRLEAAYTGALDSAAAAAADAGDWITALDYTRRLTATDPLNIAGCEREVRILIGAGKRDEAALIAGLHADVIAREIGEQAAAPLRQLASRSRATPAAAHRSVTADARRPPPFTGRENELSRLLSFWGAAREGNGGLAIVTGRAGIGKTRFLAEFCARSRALGAIRIASGRERGEWDIPYAGIADALRTLVRAPAAAGASRHLLMEAARLLPELRDRFDLPEPGPLRDDAELLRFFEGVSAFIEAVADDEPLLVQVDDFQRASPRSTQLASYLVDRLAHTSIVFAFALRTDEPGEELPAHVHSFTRTARMAAAGGGSRAIDLALGPLSDNAATELSRHIAASSEEARARAVEEARGNPGRLLALARGDIAGAGRALVPLRDILRERLMSATRQEQRLFITAAFYGCVKPIRLLAAGSHLSEAVALESALSLEAAGLIVQDGPGIAPSHPDSLALAIEGSGSAGTALLAGWAADALAAEPGALPADLARLYIAAGRGNDAAPHTRAAALHAAATGAYEGAESLLARNLALPMEDTARAELEGLVRAMGGGPARITGSIAPPRAAAPESEPRAPAPGRRRAHPLRWLAHYPYATVAGAALVLLTVVLGYQSLSARHTASGAFLTDTLLVMEAVGGRTARIFPVTGSLLPVPRVGPEWSIRQEASWVDSLKLPWVNPRRSPDGTTAVVDRITGSGAHVYLLDLAMRDTTRLTSGAGEWISLGWSPDGAWILALQATRDLDSAEAVRLYAIEAKGGGRVVPLDTAAGRTVSEAAWSPSGDRISWMARDRTGEQDVYVAALGGVPVNVSRDPGENHGIAWAPDGGTIAFTSERDGRPQIYSAQLDADLLVRRLTDSPASDNNAAVSPDGRQLAFESTRGGQLGVWLTTVVGGAAQRITPSTRSFALAGWRRAGPPRHIHRIEVDGPAIASVGDTFALEARILDQHGDLFESRLVSWEVSGDLASSIAQSAEDRDANRILLVARGTGRTRVIATVNGWRSGESSVVITRPAVPSLVDDFETGPLTDRWRILGRSAPATVLGAGKNGTRGLVAMAGRPWASGALSHDVLLLRPGLTFRVWVSAPFGEVGAARSFTMALVDDDPQLPADSIAPQPFKAAHITWAGDAGRLVYGAGREATSELTSELTGASGPSLARELRIVVDDDFRARFYVDGRERWRSNVPIAELAAPPRRVRLWLGAINTGPAVVFDDVRAGLP